MHGVRAGQARLADAERRQAPGGGLRLDRQLVRDHPHPLLDPRRLGARVRELLLLGRLGRLSGRARRARSRRVPQDRLPGHEDPGQRLPEVGLRATGRARHPVGGLGPRADRGAFWFLRPERVRPAQAAGRSGVRRSRWREPARRGVLPLRRLHRRSAARDPQRAARRRSQRCRVPLQRRGHGDPPRERARCRHHAPRR